MCRGSCSGLLLGTCVGCWQLTTHPLPRAQLTTLKKYIRSYDVNIRPDSNSNEIAIAVGRFVVCQALRRAQAKCGARGSLGTAGSASLAMAHTPGGMRLAMQTL